MRSPAPLPPPELAGYILGRPEADLQEHLNMGAYLHDAIVGLVGEQVDWPAARVLDFGCGTGRVLRHFMADDPMPELHGVDIDEDCVEWVQANLAPSLQVSRCASAPPLDFPDGHFDLIWAMSVLSHITDEWARWLLELHRITRPGGTLLLTVMGENCSEPIADEPWDPERIGMNVLGYGHPWSAGGPMILHSEWWIRAHWGRLFDVEQFVAAGAGHDAVVLRRDGRDPPTVEQLLAPEPDEPRELLAARHAIVQLHREHAALNPQHDAYAAAYQGEVARHAATQRRAEQLERGLADVTARFRTSQERGVKEHLRGAARAARRSLRS